MLDRIRHAVGRNLIVGEWNQYFPGKPYCPTFPELPVPTGAKVGEDCPKPVAKKAVASATVTDVGPKETGAVASGAARAVSAAPAPPQAAPEEPTAAVPEPPTEPSRPEKIVAPPPPATAGSGEQGQPPTAPPAPAAGLPTKATGETKLEPAPAPASLPTPATPSGQPPPAQSPAPERQKERTPQPLVGVDASPPRQPAPHSAHSVPKATSKPAPGTGPSHDTGWQIKKNE